MPTTFHSQYHRRSDPAGVDTIANAIGLDLVVGGNVVLGMSLRHEPPMFLPEVMHTFATPEGGKSEMVSIVQARLHLARLSVGSNIGEMIQLGDEMIAAFEEHERRWREARAAPAEVAPARSLAGIGDFLKRAG